MDFLSSPPWKRPRVSSLPPGAIDPLLDSFLALPDPSVALNLALERLVDRSARDSDKDRLIDRAILSGSALTEAAKRLQRKRASIHNSASWPLFHDLTIKVFSMLDTRSLCHAAATCSILNKCVMEPSCYANIDLTTTVTKVNDAVVSTMIQRAGKNLQSLKLGIWHNPISTSELNRPIFDPSTFEPPCNLNGLYNWRESSLLTRSCLLALSMDGAAAGALLRKLHLYNINQFDTSALCTALSGCRSLLDLEVVGLRVGLRRTLDTVSIHCHSIERLFLEYSENGRGGSLKSSTCVNLVNRCPHLTKLALRRSILRDDLLHILVKDSKSLKFIDLSASKSFTGTFLRDLDCDTKATALEVLILRDCRHLKEVEVAHFLTLVLAGHCQHLRYLDISNLHGLYGKSSDKPCNILVSRVSGERPEIRLLAKFPRKEPTVDTSSDDDLTEDSSSSSSSLSSTDSSSDGSDTDSDDDEWFD